MKAGKEIYGGKKRWTGKRGRRLELCNSRKKKPHPALSEEGEKKSRTINISLNEEKEREMWGEGEGGNKEDAVLLSIG